MSSALRRMGTGGSMRKRRARSLAGDDAFTKAESAPDCRCGPAIPTQTCAPASHAGSSTNDCRDHQPPIVAAWRARSRSVAGLGRSSVRRKSWPGSRAKNARLRRQGKRNAAGRPAVPHGFGAPTIFGRHTCDGPAVACGRSVSNSIVGVPSPVPNPADHPAGEGERCEPQPGCHASACTLCSDAIVYTLRANCRRQTAEFELWDTLGIPSSLPDPLKTHLSYWFNWWVQQDSNLRPAD
jgi:hypothetical protein